jgi:hypothetical protein
MLTPHRRNAGAELIFPLICKTSSRTGQQKAE